MHSLKETQVFSRENRALLKKKPGMGIHPRFLFSYGCKPRSVSKEEIFVPDKEKSAGILTEVFRAFLTRYGAKRSLLRLCIVK